MMKPVPTATYHSDMIEALAAAGPLAEYADKLMLFGRLVGGWDIEGSYFNPEGQVTKEQRGEWHFDWVLEGRAIQDVILSPPREERRKNGAPAYEYGTTVRFYDPRIDAWRVTFIAPVFGGIVNLIARPVGDEIVLEGRAPDNKLYRWIFSDITDHTFRWRGYISADEGRTWFMGEEIRARRRDPKPERAIVQAPKMVDPTGSGNLNSRPGQECHRALLEHGQRVGLRRMLSGLFRVRSAHRNGNTLVAAFL